MKKWTDGRRDRWEKEGMGALKEDEERDGRRWGVGG